MRKRWKDQTTSDGGYDSFSHAGLTGDWGLWVEDEKERRERGLEGPLD